MLAVPFRMDGIRVLDMSRMILGKTNCTYYRYINQSDTLGIWTYFSEWNSRRKETHSRYIRKLRWNKRKQHRHFKNIPQARFNNPGKQKDIAQRRSKKKQAQGRVSHRESSTTEDKRKIANREDRKETAQGQVSHRESSTTEDNRKVSQRQDRNETAQGQVSSGARFLNRKQLKGFSQRKMEKKHHKVKYLQSKVPQPETER